MLPSFQEAQALAAKGNPELAEQQSFELASESLRLTMLRYQAGEATVLKVVDAQNTLTQTHDAFDDAQARFEHIRDSARQHPT